MAARSPSFSTVSVITRPLARPALGSASSERRKPNVTYLPFAHTAATLSHLGRIDEARAMLVEVKKRKADFSAETVKSTVGIYGRHSGAEQILDGLRKAGLSE